MVPIPRSLNSTNQDISHAVRAHPCAPDGKVPGSSGLASGPTIGSQYKSGIEPREGEVFSRAELSPRFRYKPIKESEIEQLLSGGAELVF
jgi:small subunit ribosomal protein YMR-31